MNMKKIKKFFTLARRHDGFTLVELIVVIAILAILGGVAVPAYGGYVKKANKTADQTTIGEVKKALELYYYSNGGNTESFAIILDQEGNVVTVKGKDEQATAQAAAAMQAAFGEGWQTLGLKYADWKGESSALSYADSSYNGNESDLINTVDTLTSALGDVVASGMETGNNLIGGDFEQFLKDNNVDTSNGKGVGNAAVLYVAQNTQGKETEIQNAFNQGLGAYVDPANPMGSIVNNLYTSLYQTGIGEAASLAAVYAYVEGYAQATGQADEFHTNTDFSGVTNATTALNALGNSFSGLKLDEEGMSFEDYVINQGSKDIEAYIDMMGTVYDNKDIVSSNLNASDCFTDGTVEDMLKGHAAMSDLQVQTADGQVAIILYNDGYAWKTAVTPINWYK